MRKFSMISLILLLLFSTGCAGGKSSTAKNAQPYIANVDVDYSIDQKVVKLNSGYFMPVIGLGTWSLYDQTAEDSVYQALKCGYRLIDTAQYYDNSEAVGRGIKRALQDGIVERKDIFVTTKIVPSGFSDYDANIDRVIASLGLDYVDLMLVHQEGPDEVKLYKAMEKAHKAGKIRSLGISNYYTPEEFDRIYSRAEIAPAVVQNENHLFYQNKDFQKYIAQYGTVLESYYPLGGRGHTQYFLKHPVVLELANKYKRTAAQIILRWHLQSGYIAIPGSGNPQHIADNFNVFDFSLSSEDMEKLKGLDKPERFENW